MALSNKGKEILQVKIDTLISERKKLLSEKSTLINEYDRLKQKRDVLLGRIGDIESLITTLQGDLV